MLFSIECHYRFKTQLQFSYDYLYLFLLGYYNQNSKYNCFDLWDFNAIIMPFKLYPKVSKNTTVTHKNIQLFHLKSYLLLSCTNSN